MTDVYGEKTPETTEEEGTEESDGGGGGNTEDEWVTTGGEEQAGDLDTVLGRQRITRSKTQGHQSLLSAPMTEQRRRTRVRGTGKTDAPTRELREETTMEEGDTVATPQDRADRRSNSGKAANGGVNRVWQGVDIPADSSQMPFRLGSVSSLVKRMRAPAVLPSTDGTGLPDDTIIHRRQDKIPDATDNLSVSDVTDAMRARIQAEIHMPPDREVNVAVVKTTGKGDGRNPSGSIRVLPSAPFRADPTEERRGKGMRYTERPGDVRFSEQRMQGDSRSIVSEGGHQREGGRSRQPARVHSDVDEYLRGGSPAPLGRGRTGASGTQAAAAKSGNKRKKPTASEWFYIKPSDLCPGGEMYITEKLMGRLKLDDAMRRSTDDPDLYAHVPDGMMDYCRIAAIKVDRKGLEDRFYTQRLDGVVIIVNVVDKQWFDYRYGEFQKRNGRDPNDLPIVGELPGREAMPRQQVRVRSASGGSVSDMDDEIKIEIPDEHRTSTGLATGNERPTRLDTRADRTGRVSPLEATIAQILASQHLQSQRLAETQERIAREQISAMREMRTSPIPHQRPERESRRQSDRSINKISIDKFSGVDKVNGVLVQYQDWEREFLIKGGAEGFQKDTLAEKMVAVLKKPALEAYMGLPVATRKSWVLLSAAMREKFDPDNSYVAKKNFRELRIADGESAGDYFTRIQRMARRAFPQMMDEWMGEMWKDAFLNGLPVMMQQVLILKECENMTVQQCVAAVESCDKSQRLMHLNGPAVASPVVPQGKMANAVNYGPRGQQWGNQNNYNPRPPQIRPPPGQYAQSSWSNTSPRNPSPFRPSGEPGSPGNPLCFNCQTHGHIARHCPSEKRPRQQQDNGAGPPRFQQEQGGSGNGGQYANAAGKPPMTGGNTAKGYGNMGYTQTMGNNGRLSDNHSDGQSQSNEEPRTSAEEPTPDNLRPSKPRANVIRAERFMGEVTDLPSAHVLIPTGTCESTEVLPGVSVSETRAESGVGRIENIGELPECQEIAARMQVEFTKSDWDQIWVLAHHYSDDTLKSTRLDFEAARLGLERRIITYQVASKAKYFPTIDVHLGLEALVAMLRGTIMGLVAARVFELFRRRLRQDWENKGEGDLKSPLRSDMLSDAVSTVVELNELAKEEQAGSLKRNPLLCDLEATDCESDESSPEDDDEEPKRRKKRVSTMAKLARCPMDANHILEVKRRASEYIQQMTGQPFTPTVNVVQTQVEEFDDDEQPPVFVRGRVGHVECLVMLDTGANVSLLSAEFVRRYFPNVPVTEISGDKSGAGYDGQKFALDGLITLRVRVAQQSHDIRFHVSTGGKHEVLLGGNWMKAAGNVSFNVADGYVSVNGAARLPTWPRLRRQVCNVHVSGNQTMRKGFMQYLRVKPDMSGPLEQDWVFSQNDQFTQKTGLISLSTLVTGSDKDKLGFWIPVVNADRDAVRLMNNTVVGRIDYSACVVPTVNRIARREETTVADGTVPSGSGQMEAGEIRVRSVTDRMELPFEERIVEREGEELVEETYYLPQGVELHDGLDEDMKYKLTRLLHLKRTAFSEGDHDLGWCKMMKFHIDTGEARPIKTTPRRLRVIHQQRLRDYIQEQLKLGVIEPSKSPWSHNVVIVPKKGGPDRVCIDFRPVNEVTVKDAFPLPRIDDTLDRLTGSRMYAAIDLKAGYNQIQLDDESKERTAFVAEGGFWQYTRMPFGLVNAPAACQRLMEMVLAGLNWEIVLIYLDDGIIFAKDFPQLLERIEIVLDRVITAGLKLSGKKCQFAMTSVKYLGHVVSAEGVQADPETLRKITEITVPTCKKHVRSFMGLVSYYRRFGGKEFAKRTFPLNQLTQKDTPFQWTEECQQAFEWAKEMLCSTPVIQPFPDYSRPFYLCTDASAYAIGAVLEQRDDEDRPTILHAASRLLTPAERTHGAVTREAEAIYFAFKKFDALIYGRNVTVLTDQKALTYWPAKEIFANDRTLEMWLTLLCQYDFQIVHRAGIDNGNADALSRPPNVDEDEKTGQLDLRQDIRDLIDNLVSEDRLDIYQRYEVGCGALQSTVLKMSWLDDKEKEGREWERFIRRAKKADQKEGVEGEEKKSVRWAEVIEQTVEAESCATAEIESPGQEGEIWDGSTDEITTYSGGGEMIEPQGYEVNTVMRSPTWDSRGDLTPSEVLQVNNRLRRHSWGGETQPRHRPTANRVGKLMRDVETGDLYEITAEMLMPPVWVRSSTKAKVFKPRVCSIFSKPLQSPGELMKQYEQKRKNHVRFEGTGSDPMLFRDDDSRTTEVVDLPDLGVPLDCEGDFWTTNAPKYSWEIIPTTTEGIEKWKRAWRERNIQPFELATEYAEHLEQIVKGVELTDNRRLQDQMVHERFLQGIPQWMRRLVKEIEGKPTMIMAAALNIWQIRRDPRFEEGMTMNMQKDEQPVDFAYRLNAWEGGDDKHQTKWDVTSPGRMYRYLAGMPEELRLKVVGEKPANYLEAVRIATKWLRMSESSSGQRRFRKAGDRTPPTVPWANLGDANEPQQGATQKLLGRMLRRTETAEELLDDIENVFGSAKGGSGGYCITNPEKEKLTTRAFWAAIPQWIKDKIPSDIDQSDPSEVRSAFMAIERVIQAEDINAWIATSRRLQEGETPGEFVNALRPLVEFVCPRHGGNQVDEAMLRRFTAGLPMYLKEAVRGAQPQTLGEALMVANRQILKKGIAPRNPRCFMITRGQKKLQLAATRGIEQGDGHSASAHDVVLEVSEDDNRGRLDFGQSETIVGGTRSQEPESSLDPHDYCPECNKCDATEGADGEDMIFCSGCDYWHHCNCVGTSREEADKVENWYCRRCAADRTSTEQQRIEALTAFEAGEDVHAKVESELLIQTWGKAELIREQRDDPDFDIIFRLRAGEVIPSVEIPEEKRPQVLTAAQYEVSDGLLYHKHFRKRHKLKTTIQLQLCIPKGKRDEAIFSMHDSKLCGGHLGLAKVFPRLNSVYYWPNMYADAKFYIASCDKCQQRKGPPTANVVPLNPIPNVGVPLTRWVVDLMGPFGKQPTPRRNRYIVVFIDQFTKFVVARPLKDKTAKGVAEVFLKNVICEYGPPKELQSDLGSEFIALVMKELCRMLNIRQHHSTSYRPSTNGLVERFNRTLGRMLSMYVSSDHRDWDLILPYVIYAYRNAVQSATGVSPFFMVFGIEPRLLLPGDYEVDPEADSTVAEFLADRELRMRTAYQVVKRSIADNQRKQKLFHDRKARQITFKLGDSVWCYSPVVGCHRCAKFVWHWHGPFEVMEVDPNGVNYSIKRNDGKKPDPLKKVHVERLWKRTSREQTHLEGVPICSDQRHPVIADAIYDPTDIGAGPQKEILPNGRRFEVNVITMGDADNKFYIPGVPTFNGRGDFTKWVQHLEMCYKHMGRLNELGSVIPLDMFLTGEALYLYDDLTEDEQESWELCKAAMLRQLAHTKENKFGEESTSWADVTPTIPTFSASKVPSLPSTLLLTRLKRHVDIDDPEGIELWCELFRRVKYEEQNELIAESNGTKVGHPDYEEDSENYEDYGPYGWAAGDEDFDA